MTILIRLAIVAISITSCCSCAAKAPRITGTVTVTPQAPDLSGVLSLSGKRAFAQACPIGPGLALTNAHVIGDEKYHRYIWESRGSVGLLGSPRTTEYDHFRDLARVAPWREPQFPKWYDIATAAPVPGDKVHFRGWDFRKRKDAFAARDFEATVIRVRNAHVYYYPPGVEGTSGSCVLNAAGEVVAINVLGMATEDNNGVGGGVGVWGDLLQLGQERAAQ